jgi:hypothetical protein
VPSPPGALRENLIPPAGLLPLRGEPPVIHRPHSVAFDVVETLISLEPLRLRSMVPDGADLLGE